ncbi:MAG TPA: hypothetical protein VIL36_11250 [Acidimicrobiales bacterium]
MDLYTHAYHHGHRLVRSWIAPPTPGWETLARRLLTEPHLPEDQARPDT